MEKQLIKFNCCFMNYTERNEPITDGLSVQAESFMNQINNQDKQIILFNPDEGLTTQTKGDYLYAGTSDNPIEISQTWLENEQYSELHLRFRIAQPQRFAIRLWVPEHCLNACVALNQQALLNWFAQEPIITLPDVKRGLCTDNAAPISTLRPGAWQLINFRWHPDDHLSLYLIPRPVE